MNVNKFINLPDIDTAPDVYETEDTFPTHTGKGESSDEEAGGPSRHTNGGRSTRGIDVDGLDTSNLMNPEDASKRFRKAERRREYRSRSIFSYPPSSPPSPTSPTQARPLTTRLRILQAELDSLEAELSDPTNPLLQNDSQDDGSHIDPGELMRGLVDVRGRLERVKKGKEGRERLVGVVLGRSEKDGVGKDQDESRGKEVKVTETKDKPEEAKQDEDTTVLADLDRRIGELEDLVGSSSVALDETSPLPAPLLPMLTKLNAQLTLLTQPRHLDAISRRLKLLISDLDRLSANQHAQGNKRQQQLQAQAQAAASSPLQEQLLPLLARLAPHLPHLPHMLTRMRTLSTLHAAAADFQGSLGTLEEEQLRARGRLDVLTKAVEGVEKSLEDNANVMKGNVSGLEERIDLLMKRLDALS